MRILAIGDIHGCLCAFETLLSLVEPGPDDLLVTLGDYIDRGPQSRGVVDRLLKLGQTNRLVALGGNHEQMLLAARCSMEIRQSWLLSGGDSTLASYRINGAPASLDAVPEEHWKFFEGCLDWFETERWIFVHAHVAPDLPLEHQPLAQLRWEKFVDPLPHQSGKTVICGHTRQTSGVPRHLGHAVCIDTWAYGEGWLTCLEPNRGRIWQANERGHKRELWLEDFREPEAVS